MFGRSDAPQAIGSNYGVCAVPLIIGMPLAGFIYDAQLSYQGTYFFAGAPMILGACILFLMPNDNQTELDMAGAADSEKTPLRPGEGYGDTFAPTSADEKGYGDRPECVRITSPVDDYGYGDRPECALITSPVDDCEVIFDRISSV
ncbi:uncharacterized protein LOC144886155 [Branchiostoma floridae x Branchiostoma japonicum]